MDIETEVLVIGAGPVGLALAIELGTRGVRTLVAERNERGGTAPRAAGGLQTNWPRPPPSASTIPTTWCS